MCEDIERSGRDTFNALKLERQLADAGIPLFATDEPINVEGMNATTILIRRVKQGIAEWYRFSLKEKAWRGFAQHTIDGYNIGGTACGYQPHRIPHPNSAKAAQGRTKTRLTLDPVTAPAVAQIYAWRTVDKLGIRVITGRLNADPARYPSPRLGGWTTAGVYALSQNPKYTGHMVYGPVRPPKTPPGANKKPPACTSGYGRSTPPRPRTPREIEHLTGLEEHSPAITVLRTRILARFTELETERTQIGERLAALARTSDQQQDPALLDLLPQLGDVLSEVPARLQAQLFAAFGLELIYNKQDHQVTIYATITPSPPRPWPVSLPSVSPSRPRLRVPCRIGPFFAAP